MAVKTVTYSGAQLSQQGTPLVNFTLSSDDGLIFSPYQSNGANVTARASTTYHPIDIPNPLWNGVEIEWTRQADVTPADFTALFTLYGITSLGNIVRVGEKYINTCSTSETTEKIVFDLLNSACEPGLTKASDVASSGKIDLKLPMRFGLFENVGLYSAWADRNDTKCKVLPITGINSSTVTKNVSNFPVNPIDVTYDSDMRSDFGDIRFYIHNGVSLVPCIHTKVSHVASTSARFVVEIPYLPIYPNTVYLLMFYGDSTKTSASVDYATGTMIYFDDFGDNLLTGRTAPYKNYTLGNGTNVLSSSSPLMDTYNLVSTGRSVDEPNSGVRFTQPYTNFSVRYQFKLTAQGAMSGAPSVWLWFIKYQDYNNWVAFRTYWNGYNQLVVFAKVVGGTYSEPAYAAWVPYKLTTGTNHQIYIASNGTYHELAIDGTYMLGVVNDISAVSSGVNGFGGTIDTGAKFARIRMKSPYYPGTMFYGTQPTQGTPGSELSYGTNYASLDSSDYNLTTIRFTKPASWTDNAPAQALVLGANGESHWTRPAPVKATGTYIVGYDGLDRFKALRIGVETNCNEDYAFNISSIKWKVQL